MEENSWKTPNTILSIVMTALTCVSVWASVEAYHASRDAVDVMREQIKSAARPYVIADFTKRGSEEYLTLKNYGASAAHNVKIKFDPFLRNSIENGSGPVEMQDEAITFLAPGAEKEELIFKPITGMGRQGSKNKATVTYSDSSGVEYSDSMTLTSPETP